MILIFIENNESFIYIQQVIRGQATNAPKDAKEGSLPPLQDYIESANARKKCLLEIEEQRNEIQSFRRSRRPLDMS